MNSVHYNVKNDIPSQLLKNLAQTLGWNTDISPITEDNFLSSVFGQKNNETDKYANISLGSALISLGNNSINPSDDPLSEFKRNENSSVESVFISKKMFSHINK
jgi:hypothetical protein